MKLSIINDIKCLEYVRCALKKWFRDENINSNFLDNIILAMDEALTNVITHGTKNDSLSFINIEFLRENNKISVIIEDSGKYFDITKVNPPPPIKMIRKGKTHGFGIYLIKSLMDEVYYTYSKEEGINKLVLVKYI